jgi:hypothetical protein
MVKSNVLLLNEIYGFYQYFNQPNIWQQQITIKEYTI